MRELRLSGLLRYTEVGREIPGGHGRPVFSMKTIFTAAIIFATFMTFNCNAGYFAFKYKCSGWEGFSGEGSSSPTEADFRENGILIVGISGGSFEFRLIVVGREGYYERNSPISGLFSPEGGRYVAAFGCVSSATLNQVCACEGKASSVATESEKVRLFKSLRGRVSWTRNDDASCGSCEIRLAYDPKTSSRLNGSRPEDMNAATEALCLFLQDSGLRRMGPSAEDDTVVLPAHVLKSKILNIDVLGNDSASSRPPLKINRIAVPPSHGRAVVESASTVEYAIEPEDMAADCFIYEIIDGAGAISRAKVSLVPEGPRTADDAAYASLDTPLQVDVVSNDVDPWGGPIFLTAAGTPQHGAASIADGKITYSPESGFVGVDSFSYCVRNRFGTESEGRATVYVDDPRPSDDIVYTGTGEGVKFDPLANDSDPCGFKLTISDFTLPQDGNLQFLEGQFLYVPMPDFAGEDHFTYTVDNGHGTQRSANVKIFVGKYCDAIDDMAYTPEGVSRLIDVLANDRIISSAGTIISNVTKPGHGNASISGGMILYIPQTGFTGQDSFIYSIQDSYGNGDTALVKVWVDRLEVNSDSAECYAGIPVGIDVLANDSDACGLKITISSHTEPANGSLTLAGQTFTYQPSPGFVGIDTFSYEAGSKFEKKSATVSITVKDYPEPPEWSADGGSAGDDFGYSAACAGDVNGDGFDDLVVAAPHWGGAGYCRLYLGGLFGLEKEPAWTYTSDQVGSFPGFVAGAGDLNGDGFADIAIGEPLYDGNGSDNGRVLVFYGSKEGLQKSPAWTYVCATPQARMGRSVSAGDVNGDGYDDLIVGAPWFSSEGMDRRGKTYIFHGSLSGLKPSPDWTKEGPSASAEFGFSVSRINVNSDKFDDIIVGAKGLGDGENYEGAAFLFLGSSQGVPQQYAWTAQSNVNGAECGYCVSSAGDINGDGFEDAVVGAWLYGRTAASQGCAYVYLSDGNGLFQDAHAIIEGGGQGWLFGVSAASAGDVDKDGFSDVIIGGPASSNFTGMSCIHHGSKDGLQASPSWSRSGEAYGDFGYCARTAGDLNGDGFSDVVVSAPYLYGSGGKECGKIYVFYGRFDGL